MEQIKFRSAHYNFDGTFNGFSYWGAIDRFGNIETTSKGFASPTSRSGTERKFEDLYTGIKDKHGVEVFEGDIVRTDVNRKLWVITYDNHQFNFDNRLILSQGRWGSYSFKTYLDLLKKANANVEYMGNIYEDKHLLTD